MFITCEVIHLIYLSPTLCMDKKNKSHLSKQLFHSFSLKKDINLLYLHQN